MGSLRAVMSGRGRTIGVFDSGVGGLTVLRAIHRTMPDRGTAYLGDTARVPYGTRSPETVVRYAMNAARFLVDREDLGVLVVACNTASAVAVDALSEALPIPVIGVIEPTAQRAVSLSKNGRIGILGTRGTILSGAYQRAIARLRPELQTFAEPCPLFVPLAEEGWTDVHDPIARAVAERYLTGVVAQGVDVLVLGCTHYPLLEGTIRAVVGPEIVLADAAEAVAQALAGSETLPPPSSTPPLRRYYVTDLPKGFSAVAERFLGAPIGLPIEVDL